MRMLHVAAVAAALMVLPSSTPASNLPRIRSASPRLAETIAAMRVQSPTFAKMIAALDASDVVVYFEGAPQMAPRLHGCVHFMGASGGFRYVRVQVRMTMSRYDLITSIAHEMRHVVEISEHPGVASEVALAELYRDIGDEHEFRHFETLGAQRTGRAVLAEILAP